MPKLIQGSKRNARSAKKSKRNGNRNSSSLKRKVPEITVDLPFPPDFKLENFFPSKYNVSLRTLNAFIIYRKVVSAEIKKSHTLCWSRISNIASRKWNLESDKVKQHYRELAEKTKALYRSKHLFYVPQGKNAASSIMLQDNGETTENTPKAFTFVYEKNSSNGLNNEVTEQQKNAFSEQIEGGVEISELSNNANSHVLPNENEQDTILPGNTALNELINMIDFPITTFLHDDRSFPSFQLGTTNENMSGLDGQNYISNCLSFSNLQRNVY